MEGISPGGGKGRGRVREEDGRMVCMHEIETGPDPKVKNH